MTAKEFILSKYPNADFNDWKGLINGGFWKGIESMLEEYANQERGVPHKDVQQTVDNMLKGAVDNIKIKFAIEQLEKLRGMANADGQVYYFLINKEIDELKKQLK